MSITVTSKKLEELTLCARSDYPERRVVFKAESGCTFGQIKTQVLKELKLDEKDGYNLIATQYGQDVIEFAHRPDDDKATIRDRMTIFALAPARLRPQREIVKEKKAKSEEESGGVEKFKGLTPQNALSKLDKAKGSKRTTTWQYIDIWANDVIKSKNFLKLTKDQLIDFVKRDTLNVDEGDLFDAVLAWAKQGDEKAGGEKLKTLLKDVIIHVRFGLMTTEQLAAKVSSAGLLEPQQILDLFTYLAKKSKMGDDELKTLKPPESLPFNFKERAGRTLPFKELSNSTYYNWAQSGMMFDIRAKRNVVITGLGVCTRNGGSHTIQMWWRNGSSIGYGGSSAGWVQTSAMQSITATFAEGQITKLPVELKIKLKAGQSCGIYFHTTDSNQGGIVSGGSHGAHDIGADGFNDENIVVTNGPSHTSLWSGEMNYACTLVGTVYYHA